MCESKTGCIGIEVFCFYLFSQIAGIDNKMEFFKKKATGRERKR